MAENKSLKSRFIIATERLGFRWDKLGLLALPMLIFIRCTMREHNLYDTRAKEAAENRAEHDEWARPKPGWRNLYSRSPDGSYNDLSSDTMGKVYTRFGRNIPPELGRGVPKPGELAPAPDELSKALLHRKTFQPATSVNLLAAAWIQFMVHDWFGHRREKDAYLDVGSSGDITARRVRETRRDDEPPQVVCPPYLNDATHWWDASQLYGSDETTQWRLRTGPDGSIGDDGKFHLETYRAVDGTEVPDLLPVFRGPASDDAAKKTDDTGVRANWWIGLGLMHTIFAREHNAICDHLQSIYPGLNGSDTFQLARLINSALIAKIHTVEWTPALIDNKITIRGMHSSWWGLFFGEWRHRRRGRRLGAWRLPVLKTVRELLGGIPGSACDHYAAPYAITEEFVSIYRMHALIPDKIDLFSLEFDQPKPIKANDTGIENFMFKHTGEILSARKMSLAEMFYSLGRDHPGALTLKNYAKVMCELDSLSVFQAALRAGEKEPHFGDVGAIDILRDRERGVPLYNDFREFMHRPRLRSIKEFNDDAAMQPVLDKINDLYGGDIDKVDLLIGLMAEKPPEGFAFSDTAFRLFILMASRRLKSDRFFTNDYRPEIYTQAGLDWIDNNTMHTVLLRHFPELEPYLAGIDNVFRPWHTVPVHRPPRRRRFAGIHDRIEIDDPGLMRVVNDHPQIDRAPPGGGPLISRIVQWHINNWFRNPRHGPALPIFSGKTEGKRAEQQSSLEQRLSSTESILTGSETYIEKLSNYLNQPDGQDKEKMGATVQELLGRLFVDDYSATERSYRDARIVGSDRLWKRMLLPHAWAARRRLWAAARQDPLCIHATVFAIHSMAATIESMRKVFMKTTGTAEDADQIVTRCLQPPRRLLRYSTSKLRLPYLSKPLSKGTLVFFRPRGMHAGSTDSALAFAAGPRHAQKTRGDDELSEVTSPPYGDNEAELAPWNRCPAYQFVPELLKRIWVEAKQQQESAASKDQETST